MSSKYQQRRLNTKIKTLLNYLFNIHLIRKLELFLNALEKSKNKEMYLK